MWFVYISLLYPYSFLLHPTTQIPQQPSTHPQACLVAAMPRKKGCGIAEDDPFFFVKQTWSSLPEREFPVFVEDSTRDDEELQRITPATSGASRMPPPSRAGPLCHPLSSHTSSRPLRPPLQEVDTNIVATTGGHKRSDAHPGATTAAVNTPACLVSTSHPFSRW